MKLSRSPDSVSTARRIVNAGTTSLGLRPRQDAVLMVSELVTNAVVHGVGAITLRIDVDGDTVRIEVADEGNIGLAGPVPDARGGSGHDEPSNTSPTRTATRGSLWGCGDG